MNAQVLAKAKIRIVSGEGCNGTIETFGGRKTARAIAQRVKKEQCGGQRWARAEALVDGVWVKVQ